MFVYVVRWRGTDSYLGVGTSAPVSSTSPAVEPTVAKFLTEEEAFAAMTNWTAPLLCEIVLIPKNNEHLFEVNKSCCNDRYTEGGKRYLIASTKDPFLNSHLYLRLLREALHIDVRDVAADISTSSWSIVMFENDENFEMQRKDPIERRLRQYYTRRLSELRDPEIAKCVAMTRLIQYIEEGWFDTPKHQRRGVLRKAKR